MKSILFRVALLCFSVYLVINCVQLSIQLTDINQQKLETVQANDETEMEIKSLSDLIENGEDSDFIEAAARERLGFVFPDEEIYKSVSGS